VPLQPLSSLLTVAQTQLSFNLTVPHMTWAVAVMFVLQLQGSLKSNTPHLDCRSELTTRLLQPEGQALWPPGTTSRQVCIMARGVDGWQCLHQGTAGYLWDADCPPSATCSLFMTVKQWPWRQHVSQQMPCAACVLHQPSSSPPPPLPFPEAMPFASTATYTGDRHCYRNFRHPWPCERLATTLPPGAGATGRLPQ
jgi:hypothetical protein